MSKWSVVLTAACLTAVATSPALAEMMKKGETVMMMPDGRVARMMHTDKQVTDAMMKSGKPLDGCAIVMMGSDGKVYMANDMMMADGKMACETAMGKK